MMLNEKSVRFYIKNLLHCKLLLPLFLQTLRHMGEKKFNIHVHFKFYLHLVTAPDAVL